MKFREAKVEELPKIKEMYRQVVKRMKVQNINIWDEIYPIEFLKDDVKYNQLYVLVNDEEVVAALVLNNESPKFPSILWEDSNKKPVT